MKPLDDPATVLYPRRLIPPEVSSATLLRPKPTSVTGSPAFGEFAASPTVAGAVPEEKMTIAKSVALRAAASPWGPLWNACLAAIEPNVTLPLTVESMQ